MSRIFWVLEWNGDILHLISCVQAFQKVLHATKSENAPKITCFLDPVVQVPVRARGRHRHHHHHLDVFLDQKL